MNHHSMIVTMSVSRFVADHIRVCFNARTGQS